MPAKVMNGARAKLAIIENGKSRYVGLFQNVSYGLTYSAEPVYILGNFAPVEIEYTSQDAVQITCSGWRVIERGPFAEASVPKLQDLLLHEYMELVIEDRQSRERGLPDQIVRIAKFRNVRPIGFSTQISARQLEEITVNFIGIKVDDESADNHESTTAPQLIER
jgi:hypothetical protein